MLCHQKTYFCYQEKTSHSYSITMWVPAPGADNFLYLHLDLSDLLCGRGENASQCRLKLNVSFFILPGSRKIPYLGRDLVRLSVGFHEVLIVM